MIQTKQEIFLNDVNYQNVPYTHTHRHTHIYTYICIYIAIPMAYGSCHDIDLIQATAMTYDAAAAALDPLIHCTRPGIKTASLQ